MTKILATTKEAMLKWRSYLNACQYEWMIEEKENNYYLIIIIND